MPSPAPQPLALTALALATLTVLGACSRPPAAGNPPPPVSVIAVPQRTVQVSEQFSGRIEAVDHVEIRPRVAGAIEQVHFAAGELVKKGQLLFSLDARPYAADVARARAQVGSAQSQLALAEAEARRAEALRASQAIAEQEFEQLGAAARGAKSAVAAAEAALQRAELDLDYAQVRAPVAGRVSRALVTAGNLVGAGEPVLTQLVSVSPVHVYFDLSEAQWLRYGPGLRAGARVTVALSGAGTGGSRQTGRIDFVDNRLNPGTGAVRVRAVLPNADGQLVPGMFASVTLAGEAPKPALVVPERAIGTDQSRKFVMVVGEDNKAVPRPIKPGALIDGLRVVEDGLREGERIIVNGLQRARPGAPVTPELLAVDERGLPVAAAAPGAVPPAPTSGEAGAAK